MSALHGVGVLVTRPEQQATPLCRLLEAEGALTLRLPAMLLLLLWVAVQLLSDLAVPDGGASVAFRAHIGGFLAGVLFVGVLKRRDVPLFAP